MGVGQSACFLTHEAFLKLKRCFRTIFHDPIFYMLGYGSQADKPKIEIEGPKGGSKDSQTDLFLGKGNFLKGEKVLESLFFFLAAFGKKESIFGGI